MDGLAKEEETKKIFVIPDEKKTDSNQKLT